MSRELVYELYKFEQLEERETQNIAGEDGVVNEVSVLITPHLLIKAELLLTLDEYQQENYTKIRYRVNYSITSNTEDLPENTYSISANNYAAATQKPYIKITDEYGKESGGSLTSDTERLYAEYGKVNSQKFYVGSETYKSYHTYYHKLDGKRALSFNVKATFQPKGIEAITKTTVVINKTIDVLLYFDRATIPITADNFTDEEIASFTYQTITGKSYYQYGSNTNSREDSIIGLQAAISLDGVTPDIPYRDIAIDGTSYTFEFTDAEREILREKAQGSDNVPVYYLTKTTRQVIPYGGTAQTVDIIGATQRVLTIIGCNPSLNPTVKDIKPETLALTGDENTFIRYESMAEFAINAVASKHATIVSQSVTCGSKTISNLPYGVIQDVESATFIFDITDSRNMGASSSVFKNLIEYVKPTCYQKVEMLLTGETSAAVKISVNGSYYNGAFGLADNSFLYQVRHTDNSGNMGEWFTIDADVTFDGESYELEVILSGFDYGKAYTFQSRVIDKLNTVQSAQYTIRYLPIFDWGETDFNFNVPVNINAEEISMHDNTVLRYNKEAKNTVLSGGGGNIYLRPGGSNNTSAETIFYGNGEIKLGGTVTFDNGFTIGGNSLEDFIIERGEASMGSNGTWYWCKWASGKAETWGCRNFGNMAVNTAWGGLYRSAILTQDLPEDVFITTPDVININIVNSNFGGWICKHENLAPSAVTTGSFIYVRPASATVTPTYIGFHVIGVWKQ